MRRQILSLTGNVIATILLVICIGAPAYARQSGQATQFHRTPAFTRQSVRATQFHRHTNHTLSRARAHARRAGSSLPSPWISQDIGPVGVAGSVSSNSNIFTVQGSGTDIWYNADQFRYVYQPLQGDGALLTRVDSQSGADAWAKAGIMIRESLDPNSPYVFVMVTPGNGLAFQSRMTAGGPSSHQLGASAVAPYWLELMRQGNDFTAYASSDGQTWAQVGTTIILNISTSAYIGLAVTSHNNTVLNTATFSNVSPSSNPLPPPLTQPSNLALNASVSASSYIPGFNPGNAVDGSTTTFWENLANDAHPWITVDLGTAYPVSSIILSWLDSNTRTFNIQGSSDDKTWTAITSIGSDTNTTDTFNLSGAPVFARYFRLVIPQNSGSVYKLAEFQCEREYCCTTRTHWTHWTYWTYWTIGINRKYWTFWTHWPNRTHRAFWPFWTHWPNWTYRKYWSNRKYWAFWSFWSFWTHRPNRTYWTNRKYWAFWPYRPVRVNW